MIGRNAKKGIVCKTCGRCCTMEIPLTLLDIYHMAQFKELSVDALFQEAVQDKISELSSLFMIRKKAVGVCLFLTDEKKCSIHSAKPAACRFYNCSLKAENNLMPWTSTCIDPAERSLLWEQSVAASVTKAYIKKNGPVLNDKDFHLAIKAIKANIPVRKTQKLKLARDNQEAPIAMIYDCSTCEKRGTHAKETPVTLDDIRRISTRLKMTWKDFINTYVSTEPSIHTGGFKLYRNIHCVFYQSGKGCRVETVKPLHCRFTPCPIRIKTPEMMDAFYLGSGTVKEQFRHQVALMVTREYVSQFGIRYGKSNMEKSMASIDRLTASASELNKFCKQIAPFRYVNDTLPILNV